jgi:hypothetical protein
MWLASEAWVSYHQNINSHTLRVLLQCYVFRLRRVCENLWYHGRPAYNRHISIPVLTSMPKFITRWLFHGVDLTNPRPNLQVGLALLVGCPLRIIHYICSYPPYLEAICGIRSLMTLHDALANLGCVGDGSNTEVQNERGVLGVHPSWPDAINKRGTQPRNYNYPLHSGK